LLFFKDNEDIVVLISGVVVTLIVIAIPKVELFDEVDLSQLPDDVRPDEKSRYKLRFKIV
jgi:hypothetical protein